jgi:hypothetical protein
LAGGFTAAAQSLAYIVANPLIGRSLEQVEQGTTLVGEAGKTMDEIVGSIRRVTDIVAEISSASVEQSSGVQQVGQAISQMDQATQQNAALVEESAAAAESLKMQAQQLVQTVAVFKLARQDGSGFTVLPAAALAGASPGERRGPDRAKTITRPAPKVRAIGAPATRTAPSPTAPPKTDADDWTTF